MNNNQGDSIRVATYARVSTQEQVEGTSMEFQDAQLTGYCALQNWTIINAYTDPGFSGKNGDRPGLERLLADAKIGLFDKVLVFKLDRLARNLRLLLEIEQKLRSYGISLISVKEAIDTSSSTGKMMFQMFGMVAEWEREAIIERTSNGKLQRFKEGCWAGGKTPFGYAYDKATKKLVVDENNARTIRRIFYEYADGKTLYGISDRLNKDKIPARGKNSPGWRQTAIRQVLINPTYKGMAVVHRYSHISDINKIDLSKTIQVPVPPLVDEQIWNICQERLKNNKQVRPLSQGEFLLQGMITCGTCGYAYRAERFKDVRYYMCRGKMAYHHLDGSPRCQSPSIKAEWLENEVWKRILEIINDPDLLEVIINDSINTLRLKEADLNARIKPITDRLAEIAEQKAKLADDWIIRHMNSDKFRELKASLDQEETRIRALKAKIDPAQILELESTRGKLRYWENIIKDMMVWNTVDADGNTFKQEFNSQRIALKMVGFEDKEISDIWKFPATKRDMLNKLQIRLVVFNDRIEVNGLFPIEPINIQSCTSTGLR
jgi:site-specific DNA recombinase